MRYVPSRAVAEEVVQDTWIGVIQGIDRFEGRSTIKTWLYKILIYRARAGGARERRTTPMSSLAGDDTAPSVPTERFRGSDALWAGHWATPPRRWDGDAEDRLLAGEARSVIDAVIAELPLAQREVIVMRDLSQFTSTQVCDLLGVTEKTGSLTAGKFADVVAVAGNPLTTIQTTEHPVFVMKEGTIYVNESAPAPSR